VYVPRTILTYGVRKKHAGLPFDELRATLDQRPALAMTFVIHILNTPKFFSSTGEFNTTDNANPHT